MHVIQRIGGGLLLTALALVLLASRSEALIVAASAADVCLPTADPCIITETVQAVDGAVLDFGARAVVVNPGGQIDVGAGTVVLLCGHLSLATGSATAISLQQGTGGVGGVLSVTARRTCSDGVTLCATENDCSGLGTCSLGSGAADLNGRIDGDANPSAQFALTAAGNIVVTESISLSGTSSLSTGGNLDLSSRLGSMSISATIDVSGGGLAEGGSAQLSSMRTMTIASAVDASGGDFDGGSITIRSDSNGTISADLRADSKNGEGFGGFIDVVVGGELSIIGGSAGVPLLVSADGNGAGGFGGDGGEVILDAGGNVSIGEFVAVRARGAIPDGFGGDVVVDAGATLSVAGDVRADARGANGAGGFVDLRGIDISLGQTASIDLTGGGGGGDLTLFAADTIAVGATIDLSATGGGPTGSLTLVSGGSTTVSGSIAVTGTPDPSGANLTADTCAFTLMSGALVDNGATNGINRLTAHGLVTLEAGATMRADGTNGVNTIVYANPSQPPSVVAIVTPAPQIGLDEAIGACTTCSIAADCDDANVCTDDLCDPALGCTNTPNAVACDDGLACTSGDVCTGGSCVGAVPMACNDGNVCTDDGCDDAVGCTNTPNIATCDDGLTCTLSDSCNAGVCVGTAPAACDDGDACTRDSCDDVVGCIHQAGPALGCLASGSSKVRVRISDSDSKDTVSWKWSRGDAFTHSDIGSPATITDYTLCVFDHSGSVPILATELLLPPDLQWQERSNEKGWQYKSKLGEHAGIRKLTLKPKSQGKSSLKLTAKGSALPEPLPVSPTAMFDNDPRVTVQLIAGANICWSVDYEQPASNTADQYKASRK